MIKLGMRYIALRRDGSLYETSSRDANNEVKHYLRCQDKPDDDAAWIEVDFDAARTIDCPEDEYVERAFITAWTRLQELRPDAQPDEVIAGELARLAHENARMRRLCETACNWSDGTVHVTSDELSRECDLYKVSAKVGNTPRLTRDDIFGCSMK